MKGNIDAPLTELNSLKLKKFKVKKISLNSHTIFWICLHAKPHLFVFNLVPFRAFFSHLGSLGIFGEGRLGSGSKTFLWPTIVEKQLWVVFTLFESFQAIFGVRAKFNNFLMMYICRHSTLVFKEQPYLSV